MNELFKLAYFCTEPDREAMRQNNHLPAPWSLHQAVLDLAEPSAPVMVGEVVVRRLLLLCLLDLPGLGQLPPILYACYPSRRWSFVAPVNTPWTSRVHERTRKCVISRINFTWINLSHTSTSGHIPGSVQRAVGTRKHEQVHRNRDCPVAWSYCASVRRFQPDFATFP